MKKTFQTLQDLAACVGQEVAVSDWITITQAQVNQFAEATGDHQWIHVDVERAKAGPFGGPIAHGFLTLTDGADVLYHITDTYEPSAVAGFAWDDPSFGIEWPIPPVVMSEKDKSWSPFER